MTPVSPVFKAWSKEEGLEFQIAKDQPQYQTLPAIISHDRRVFTRWTLSFKERLSVLLGGSIWLVTKGVPVNPVMMHASIPELGLDEIITPQDVAETKY